MRKWQLLLFDIPFRQSCTGMSFTHTCMTLPSFFPKYLSSDDSVTNIRFCAVTFYSRCISTEDTDVVKHCCLLEKLLVEFQFGMCLCYLQAAVGHLSAVYQEYFPEFIILRVILVYYLLVVHS